MDNVIKDLMFIKEKLYNGIFKEKVHCIDKAIKFIKGNDWIPCTVVDHPEHCNDCEVTIIDKSGVIREIAYYTDRWRLTSNDIPVIVIAWKEPSLPYDDI